jgi:hypothetical protein
MYKYFKDVRDMAETVSYSDGTIETIDMGPWGKDSERICITGKTHNGNHFELTLEITKQEVVQDGT